MLHCVPALIKGKFQKELIPASNKCNVLYSELLSFKESQLRVVFFPFLQRCPSPVNVKPLLMEDNTINNGK